MVRIAPNLNIRSITGRLFPTRTDPAKTALTTGILGLLTKQSLMTLEQIGAGSVTKNWNGKGPSAVPSDIDEAAKAFLGMSENILNLMQEDCNALLASIGEFNLNIDPKSLPQNDADILKGITSLLQGITDNRTTVQKQASQLLELIDMFSPRLNNAQISSSVIEPLRKVLDIIQNNNGGEGRTSEIEQNMQEVMIGLNDFLRKEETRNWSLFGVAVAAIAASASYISYRSYTLLIPGYTALDYIAAATLFFSEVFYFYHSGVYNSGLIYSLLKTKGGEGRSWEPKPLSKLPHNPKERPRSALYLPCFFEPVLTMFKTTMANARAAWDYGNALFLLAEQSRSDIYYQYGIEGGMSECKRATALKVIVERIAKKLSIDDVKAHYLSNTVASKETEIDDPATSKSGFKRALTDIPRAFSVMEKKLERIGEKLSLSFAEKFEQGTLTEKEVKNALINEYMKHGISIPKIKAVIPEVTNKIASLLRQSQIARDFDAIFNDLRMVNRVKLIECVAAEFDLTQDNAEKFVNYLAENRKKIKQMSEQMNDDFDLYSDRAARAVYYETSRIMDHIMVDEQTKGDNPKKPAADLAELARQVAAWEFYIDKRNIVVRLYEDNLGLSEYRKCEKIGKAVAEELGNDHGVKLNEKTEEFVLAGLSFESARQLARQSRRDEIKRVALDICRRYKAPKKYREAFAERIAEELHNDSLERDIAAKELLQGLAFNIYVMRETFNKDHQNSTEPKNFIEMLKDMNKNAEAIQAFGSTLPKEDKEVVSIAASIIKTVAKDVPDAQKDAFIKLLGRLYKAVNNDQVQKIRTDLRFDDLSLEIEEDAVRDEVWKYVRSPRSHMDARKPGGINKYIHGRNVPEMIGEIFRQVILFRIMEKNYKKVFVPDEIITDIDKNIVPAIPRSVPLELSRADHVAQKIVSLAVDKKDARQITLALFKEWGLEAKDNKKTYRILRAVAEEIRLRIALSEGVQSMGKESSAASGPVIDALAEKFSFSAKAKNILAKYINEIADGKQKGIYLLGSDPHTGRYSISLSDKGREEHIKSAFIINIQHLMITPEGRSSAEIAENFLSVRRIPDISENGEQLGAEIRKIAPFIEMELDKHGTQIQDLVKEGVPPKEAAKRIIEAVRQKMAGQDFRNYLDEEKPHLSVLDYEVIGFHDADYRPHREVLSRTVPIFIDHPSYSFAGNRQFGFNTDNPTARALQRGGDAFWGWTNITNSLLNVNLSWGSCVFHSMHSYSVHSRWISREYHTGTLSSEGRPKITKDKREYVCELKTSYEKRKIADGVEVDGNKLKFFADTFKSKKEVEKWLFANRKTHKELVSAVKYYSQQEAGIAGKFTPRKGVYWLGRKLEGALKPDKHKHLTLAKAYAVAMIPARLAAIPLNWPLLSLADWLYAAAVLKGRDYLHDKGIWKRPENQMVLNSDNKEAMITVSDFRTESEDIASSPFFVRNMGYMTGKKVPLSQTLFLEGIGGIGEHAEDKDSNEVGHGGRWPRGNLSARGEILTEPMGPHRKMRVSTLPYYWATGVFRYPLLFAPLSYMFLKIKPLEVGDPGVFLPLMALNVAAALGSFVYSMRVRGKSTTDAFGSMPLEYCNLTRMLMSNYEGLLLGERPPFKRTPKEKPIPIKAPMRNMKFEHFFNFANIAGVSYAAYFSFTDGGNIGMLLPGFWAAFHATLLSWSILSLNKGVRTEPPIVGPIKHFWGELTKDWPRD